MTGSRSEFPRRLAIADVRAERTTRRLEATEAERAAIARRLDLPAIEMLTADIAFKTRNRGRAVEVAGHLSADVVQTCVVTLEPLPARIEEDFLTLFVPDLETGDVEVDPEGAADVEPLPATAIDLGELVVQTLSLALDPYPRAPGAGLPEGLESGSVEPDERADGVAETAPENAGPFAALDHLRGRR